MARRAAAGATLRPKIRARFGGRIKALVSGGAPLNPEVGGFFQAMGLTMLQGYGQTESAPGGELQFPLAGIKLDTVGPPLRGVEVRIAEDGEILVRGELVMLGYWRTTRKTARGAGRWLAAYRRYRPSGRHGRIVITDRKKDIIVNDKGDNVAPQKLEGMLTLQPEIAQAMVIGRQAPVHGGAAGARCGMGLQWARANREKFDLAQLRRCPPSAAR